MSDGRIIIRLIVAAFLLSIPIAAWTETDFRIKMLVTANIDGYPGDDDITAINNFLCAIGDSGSPMPADIADWIIGRIGSFSGHATPRLIRGYMHFLRAGVTAPPFPAGDPASPRNRLLHVVANDLAAHKTPLANLGLLMFMEANDDSLRQLANTADYTPIKSFPWQIGFQDWMNWILVGLHPDSFSELQGPDRTSPAFPVVTPRAKAALLLQVRQFLATVNIRPPVSRSSVNFFRFEHNNQEAFSWASIVGPSSGVQSNPQNEETQVLSLVPVISARISNLLGVPLQGPNGPVGSSASLAYLLFGANFDKIFGAIAQPYLISAASPAHRTSSDDLVSLAAVIGAQQARLLALSAYGLMAFQRRHNTPAQDIAMEQVMDHLAAVRLPPAEAKTTLVQSFSPTELAQAQGPDLAGLSRCQSSAAKVVNRRVSLRDHLYLETMLAQCADNTQLQWVVLGSIPTDLVRMLEINVSYFDIIGGSLATLNAETPDGEADDISLVENDPTTAIAMCLAALFHPEVPWRYSRDVLMEQYPRSVQWFVPGWRPAMLSGSGNRPVPFNGRVMVTRDEFTAQQQTFLSGEQAFMQDEARQHFLDIINPVVSAMSDTQSVCNPVPCSNGIGICGQSCSDRPTPKHAYINHLQEIASQIRGAGSPLSNAFCLAPHSHDKDLLTTLINQDTNEIIVRYDDFSCIAVVQSTLPPALASLLLQASELDPRVLNRYQIDLFASADDAKERAARILGSRAAEKDLQAQVLAYLRSTGLIWYLTDIPAPLGNVETIGDFTELDFILRHGSPLLATAAPLLRTPTGLDLATDLGSLQQLAQSLPPAEGVTRPQISDEFMAQRRSDETMLLNKFRAQVDAQAASIRAAIQAQQSNFSFGIQIGVGAAIVPSFAFTYNGIGINVSLQLPTALTIAPILPSFSLPSVPFAIPGVLASGLLPNFPVPLTQTPPPLAANRAPAGAADQPPPNEIIVTVPDIPLDSLLSQSNLIGRDWLNQEFQIAKPLLTPVQVDSINQAFQLPTFPEDLARLIAEKAVEASTQAPPLTGASGSSVESVCSTKVWSSCGIEIQKALDNTTDLERVVALATVWSDAFNRAYDDLRRKGQLQRATPESERISEVLNENFNPLDVLADHVQEEAFEHYFPRLAAVCKWVPEPIVAALKAFFDSQAIGTDLDDLLTMDKTIQETIGNVIEPHLKPDFQTKVTEMVQRATPSLQAPLP